MQNFSHRCYSSFREPVLMRRCASTGPNGTQAASAVGDSLWQTMWIVRSADHSRHVLRHYVLEKRGLPEPVMPSTMPCMARTLSGQYHGLPFMSYPIRPCLVSRDQP